MGCLLALVAGVFPRLALCLAWVARPSLVTSVFGSWIPPLIGVVLFPLATIVYLILYSPDSALTGREWLLVIVAALLDMTQWAGSAARVRVPRGL